jgi:signal transduction histidine kinase
VKHASATHATIALETGANEARLTVTDDGVGFDPTTLSTRAGASDSFGLRAIAERVEQLGGELEVTSAAGAGTTVRVVVKGLGTE